MSTPAAVVFDCDGVLVDSEPHSVAAWMTVLGELEHPADRTAIDACLGLGFEATHGFLSGMAPLPEPDAVWPRLLDALRESFQAGLHRFDDSGKVLEAVGAAGITTAVASASPRPRLDLTLEIAGLAGRFVLSVAGDEVARSKPAPDVYLAALAGLGVGAESAVAIEDSPLGVASAVSAGLRTIGVIREGGIGPELAAAGASIVVERLLPAQLGL